MITTRIRNGDYCNHVNIDYSTVIGGKDNTAKGLYSMVGRTPDKIADIS